MPLLPLEPFVYPEDLLRDRSGPAPVVREDSGRWWVVHARPRAEIGVHPTRRRDRATTPGGLAVEEGREPSNGARGNLDALALVFAAIASSRRGVPVAPGSVASLAEARGETADALSAQTHANAAAAFGLA